MRIGWVRTLRIRHRFGCNTSHINARPSLPLPVAPRARPPLRLALPFPVGHWLRYGRRRGPTPPGPAGPEMRAEPPSALTAGQKSPQRRCAWGGARGWGAGAPRRLARHPGPTPQAPPPPAHAAIQPLLVKLALDQEAYAACLPAALRRSGRPKCRRAAGVLPAGGGSGVDPGAQRNVARSPSISPLCRIPLAAAGRRAGRPPASPVSQPG